MKRYFFVKNDELPPIEPFHGAYAFIDLGSHGTFGEGFSVLCAPDDHSRPAESWVPFPSVLDASTTLSASQIPVEKLSDIGLTGQMTALQAVAHLHNFNSAMAL